MINKINNSPTFASKMYISAYTGASHKQREFLTSQPVLDELHILQENGSNDIVTIIPAAKTEDILAISKKHIEKLREIATENGETLEQVLIKWGKQSLTEQQRQCMKRVYLKSS